MDQPSSFQEHSSNKGYLCISGLHLCLHSLLGPMALKTVYKWPQMDISCPDLSTEQVHPTANLTCTNSGHTTICIVSKTGLFISCASKSVADPTPSHRPAPSQLVVLELPLTPLSQILPQTVSESGRLHMQNVLIPATSHHPCCTIVIIAQATLILCLDSCAVPKCSSHFYFFPQ